MSTDTASVVANGFEFTVDLGGPLGGELVLFCHGFPQTRHTWRLETGAVGSAGFRACAPDQRGYSSAARPSNVGDYVLEHLVDDVVAIARGLGHDRFHLVGHDWGGQVAWATTALHPDRVQSLTVLSRPHPAALARSLKDATGDQRHRSRHHRAFQRPEATNDLLADDAARLRETYRRGGVPERDADVYLDVLSDEAALDAALNWYRAGRYSEIDPADLTPIVRPTLYVWGAEDTTVGRTSAEGTAREVTAPYRFVELPAVGHFVTDQAPGTVAPLLIDHLTSHPIDPTRTSR